MNERPEFRRNLMFGTFSVFVLATIAGTQSKGSGCVGTPEWNNWRRKDIATCINKDGRILVEGPNTQQRLLPESVKTTMQVWANDEEKVYWIDTLSPNKIEIGSMNLATGEINTPRIFSIY